MIHVGVTGLRDLKDFDLAKLEKNICKELERLKEGHDKAVMLNSISIGADQMCAKAGLFLGYELICPLPFPEYRNDFRGEGRARYDSLLKRAGSYIIVSDGGDKDGAYLTAGKYIVHHCDVLLAVWDGRPQSSICGTAAVVAYAKSLRKEIIILS